MKLIVSILVILPLLSQTQVVTTSNIQYHPKKGIQWIENLTWEQVKSKAKEENKYIFVDCYATWCKPCKVMDKEVYPNDTIGRFMNSHFISVKVQMDTTKNDKEEIKRWYATARAMKNEYDITAMPTFLFFSPSGRIVHKDIGGKNVQQLMALSTDATNPGKRYYNLVRKYEEGQLDYRQMPALAKMAKTLKDKDLALKIAGEYMRKYLDNLSEETYIKKENLDFIGSFAPMIRLTDRIFRTYLYQSEKIDAVFKPGYSKKTVKYVITKEYITPALNDAKLKAQVPFWKRISKTIQKKYGVDFAEEIVLEQKVNYYKEVKDWKNYTKMIVQKVKREKREDVKVSSNYLNSMAWEIFLYSNNNQELKIALDWSDDVLQLDSVSINAAPNMDTKANLLYKLGEKSEAIAMQEKAFQKAVNSGLPETAVSNFQKTLEKMKKGEPTHLGWGAIWSKKRLPGNNSLE